MESKTYIASGIEDLPIIARDIAARMGDEKILILRGEMGSGKTTFLKSLCKELGCTDEVSSPTYAIVNEYLGKHKIYHFDLFRLKTEEELLDLGFEEYLSSGDFCFIEWPELALVMLESYHSVDISISETGERIIKFE